MGKILVAFEGILTAVFLKVNSQKMEYLNKFIEICCYPKNIRILLIYKEIMNRRM